MKNKKEKYRSGEKALTKAQVEKFLSVIDNLQDKAMFEIAITLGLRRIDLVNIKANDIDLNGAMLTYYEHKKRRTRTVPISDHVVTTLSMCMKVYKPGKKGVLFPISERTAYNRFQMYLQRAELPQRPIHALRATCIKLCQANGWTPEQTAELVGDKVQTIQEHYTTPSVEEMREVVKQRSVI